MPSAGVVEVLIPERSAAMAIDRINELEVADVEGIVVLPGAAEALAAVKGAKSAIATSCTVRLWPRPGSRRPRCRPRPCW